MLWHRLCLCSALNRLESLAHLAGLPLNVPLAGLHWLPCLQRLRCYLQLPHGAGKSGLPHSQLAYVCKLACVTVGSAYLGSGSLLLVSCLDQGEAVCAAVWRHHGGDTPPAARLPQVWSQAQKKCGEQASPSCASRVVYGGLAGGSGYQHFNYLSP
jgi:hypothetical protein